MKLFRGAALVFYKMMQYSISMQKQKLLNLKNIVWREGKHYVAQCLNVDISSFGATKKEALANLDEALALYFEDIRMKSWNFLKIERPEIISATFRYA